MVKANKKPTNYIEWIPHDVCGIPCMIGLKTYLIVKGSYNRNESNSDDYYGYEEIEYDILDRKGYYAQWLENKLNDREYEKIDIAIDDYMKAKAEEYWDY